MTSRLLFLCASLAIAIGNLNRISQPTPFGVSFVDVASQAGLPRPVVYGGIETKKYIIETNGCGVAFLDYDEDGWMDVLLLSGTRLDGIDKNDEPTNRLYRNNHDGTFSDVTDKAGLRRTGWASSICVGDYDNDGHDDLFITYWGRNVLYHNNGNGTFTDVTARAGLDTTETRWGSGCTFIDYDGDGNLDLFVANYLTFDLAKAPVPGVSATCVWKGIPVNCGPKGLPFARNWLYRNNGKGSFTDVSRVAGIATSDDVVKGRYAMTAVAADFTGDGWTDIYVACDSTASILYRNNRDGTFTDIALESGVAYNEDGNAQAGMGLGIGDYNRDGKIDIFKTHFADDTPILYRNAGQERFEDVTAVTGLTSITRFVSWGAGMPDLDNDGWPDIFFVTGSVYPEVEKFFKDYPYRGPRVVFRNLGGNRFENVTSGSGPGATELHSSRGCAFGDFDNDGDLDVLIMNMNEPPSLLRNDYKGGNHWLKVRVEGEKANRSGIGARVVVTTAGLQSAQPVLSQSSYYSHDDMRLNFGLGKSLKADRVDVYWPGGRVDSVKDVQADQMITIKEGIGVSAKQPIRRN
jgi:hypothetical protein